MNCLQLQLSLSHRLSVGWGVLFLAIHTCWAASPSIPDLTQHPGKKVYQEHCTQCHGKQGEGVPGEYEDALFGDRSVKSLTGLITRTMPEDDPEIVTDEQAAQVADYIYHAFYSEAAREAALPPARIQLARLTVAQYRNSITDLVGAFPFDESGTPSQPVSAGLRADGEKGLSVQIYQSKGMSKADKKHAERIDATIQYAFGEGSPHEEITADQFSLIWDGALEAPETGEYEFRIETENGARLYLNRENTGKRRRMRDDSSEAGQAALIDGWVSSGKHRALTAKAYLLGGRLYPLRIEFFKYKEKTASVKVDWKRPHGTWEPLDQRFTTTRRVPRSFVVSTPFPADDRSFGYERGTAVSSTWQTAITQGAVATASEVVNRLPYLAQLYPEDDAQTRQGKLQQFILRFAERAYRRPLADGEAKLFRTLLDLDTGVDSEAAVRRSLLLVLTSPHFLYPDFGTGSESETAFGTAARLALALWDSLPDEALWQAARDGSIKKPDVLDSQVTRMVGDARTQAKLRRFFNHWLEIEDRDLTKDPKQYPEFTPEIVTDLRYSLQLFIDQVVWSEPSDYRQLLLADTVLLNDRLRALYSPHAETDSDMAGEYHPVSLGPDRAGILTHPLLLAAFAYHDTTSPIHRGVFLTRNVMGRRLKPPPEAVAFKNDEFPDDLTMREKITELTKDAACMTCHSVINPLGFTLEAFDTLGRKRADLANVDTRSDYTTLKGETLELRSARQLAEFAAQNPASHRAFVTHLFHHLIKQDLRAYGADTEDRLTLHFAENGYSIRQLIGQMAILAARANASDKHNATL